MNELYGIGDKHDDVREISFIKFWGVLKRDCSLLHVYDKFTPLNSWGPLCQFFSELKESHPNTTILLYHSQGPPRGKRDGVIRDILERDNGNWMEKLRYCLKFMFTPYLPNLYAIFSIQCLYSCSKKCLITPSCFPLGGPM